jgi:hypothetical protein
LAKFSSSRWSRARMDMRVPFDRRWKNQYTMYSSGRGGG